MTTVSFRLARNNVFCHNFVNNWNFFLKRVSYERTHANLSQKCAIFVEICVLTENIDDLSIPYVSYNTLIFLATVSTR